MATAKKTNLKLADDENKLLTAAELDGVSDEIQKLEDSIQATRDRISELKAKAQQSLGIYVEKFGLSLVGDKKPAGKKPAATNNAEGVKAELRAFVKDGKTKLEISDHLKKKLGINRFLPQHYTDTIRYDDKKHMFFMVK